MSVVDRNSHFATVYVTVASVLLGLALEDLVSILRELEVLDALVWAESAFIVVTVLNAWVAYSSIAISITTDPTPWDAANVFLLAVAHFALNSFVGTDAHPFFFAVGAYNISAVGVVYYNIQRAARDPNSGVEFPRFKHLMVVTGATGVAWMGLGWASYRGMFPAAAESIVVTIMLIPALVWIVLFWRAWASSRVA